MSDTRLLRISNEDNVAVALVAIAAGTALPGGAVARTDIPAGHKIALRDIPQGVGILKFGQVIGEASSPIAAGDHVHVHNVAFAGRADRAVARGAGTTKPRAEAWFDGYIRADGRVGTRNYIAVLTSVNCSATVARRIADHFSGDRLLNYPNVDGVVAFSHTSGCGMAHHGRGIDNLRRTIEGYAVHPNFGGVLVVGLGCEVNQISELDLDAKIKTLTIQDAGGTRAAIDAGVAAIEAMLPAADRARRNRVSAEHLIVGLQCGGSDGYSALSSNPALGLASDRLVEAGGTVILSETPEIFGAENLLLARASSSDVASALIQKLEWWEEYAAANGADLNNNPSPGNIEGGITTILEKSLGAVAKAGSSPLTAVIDYAAKTSERGFIFMDSPGYDPCSATGQIAAGANLIAFTTGRGSVFGSKPTPTLKLASNSELAREMADDIDIDCGRLLEGTASLEELGEEIFKAMLNIASERRTASELDDVGDYEFVPWVPGAMM